MALILLGALALGSVGCSDESDIGSSESYSTDLEACETGRCWTTGVEVRPCGFALQQENFSSGRYDLHRYSARVGGEGETRIVLSPTAGDWKPAILVTDGMGGVLFDGVAGVSDAFITLSDVPRLGPQPPAEVVFTGPEREVNIYVTSRGALESEFAEGPPTDTKYQLVVDHACELPAVADERAPFDTVPGALLSDAGLHALPLGDDDWGPAMRFDVPAGTHAAFRLLDPGEMAVAQWREGAVTPMRSTDGDGGRRVLSVLDPEADRTYWVRARGGASHAELSALFTPFREDYVCEDDCARLMQLPLPNDAELDGYDMRPTAVLRRQYGRRDLLMALRHSGRLVAGAGMQAFTVEDLSNWDGSRPPGHASHTEGKDVDISVYDADGAPTWAPQCNEVNNNCISGTSFGMDMEAMAVKIGGFLDSNRVTNIFFDREFHPGLFSMADELVDNNVLPDGQADDMRAVVSHWPNHNNHLHLRFQTN